jgi:uncharacterized protein (TIGR03545 family)
VELSGEFMTEKNIEKKNKKKGPIRLEAVVPVLILSILTFVYFSFYFDHHLKKLVEYVGTQANGAEVNVDSINTSFIKGSFLMNRLQVTNKELPKENILEIGNMHFQYLWDALIRLKFVVDDASISNIQIHKPRTSPGHVLPPEPAKPSKMNEIQNEVLAQVKNKYSGNVLGNLVTLLQGGDYKEQIEQIRGELKSEARVKEMLADVNTKKAFWDSKVKELGDTSKIKEIESEIQKIKEEKNFLKQVQSVPRLNELLKSVEKQYKEVEKSSTQLQGEVKILTQYPHELQSLVTEDVATLKDRFKIPKIDFKDMAMHLFAGEFGKYIADARKYQALAKQYIPKKKENKDEVVPHKRLEGKLYHFPVTTGYPLFWLKRAAISSSGTAGSYSGNVSGELTNVTNAPKQIMKPIKLDLKGDFPSAKVSDVEMVLTIDHTHEAGKETALIKVGSFIVPERLFVNDDKMKFGFQNANGSSVINATLQDENVSMSWKSTLKNPKFIVETSSKLAKEIMDNVLNAIPAIHIDGSVSGTFKNLDMKISSNLGDELGSGFSREIGHKVDEAQAKLKAMVDEKINGPKNQLTAALNGNTANLSQLGNLQDFFKKNQGRLQEEINKLAKGGAADDIKDKAKKIFKGFKL